MKYNDLTRKEKDEVIKAMKNPNWEECFLSDKGDPDCGCLK